MNQQFKNTINSNGFSPDPKTTHTENGIVVQDMQLSDSVFWVNNDNTKHQPYPTTGTPGDWGPPIDPSASSQQMNPPVSGEYAYACAINPKLTGMIHVAIGISIDVGLNDDALFNPPALILPPIQTINWGTPQQRVSWSNSDDSPHQPTPKVIPSWFSNPIKAGDVSPQITVNNGDIEYYDLNNPSMTGKILNPVQISAPNSVQPVNAAAYVGQSISWTNNDDKPHRPVPVAGQAPAWFADPIPAKKKGSNAVTASSHVFSKAGTFQYQIDGTGQTFTVTITAA